MKAAREMMRLALRIPSIFLLTTFLLLACVAPKNSPNPVPSTTTPGIGPASCSLGQDWCQGRCVDTITFVTDSANCGRCGNQCAFSETCNAGFCDCAPGYEKCMGSCVNSAMFVSDSQNCGRCGNSCGIGETCLGGMCQKL